jgi:hypothetical protein
MLGIQRKAAAYLQAETVEQKDHSVIAECLAFISGRLPQGITLQIDQTGVSASMGNERFALHPNRYELQTDIEALCRLATRRLQ